MFNSTLRFLEVGFSLPATNHFIDIVHNYEFRFNTQLSRQKGWGWLLYPQMIPSYFPQIVTTLPS